ncbi:hypothetical protein [Mesorhizobium sp.]|uniref:hypothetical protein n=1 Tax=Mesorhizobium sp. TaxID=1871066 RepID=UPI000FE2B7AE|nr:hypothetical protein [Mesorhizobium sp.]RWN50289.1 MAG: hypothetical protein EOR98_32570 [Mesorhizobium sp.]RWN70683.1 MAG: hypothetical protein EOS02_33060 [Mesorhizobium sp.]RWN71311.1 MAG: hypothetical protein EOS01_31290 [Mesorhizobium sp.]RWN82302.1 MAG: hypothetical protein EOS04_32130 [Mesorhizobium sp.]RWO06750.1 MAG: hypothetical protein EOS15_32700 [Mesorhizobium sp.]
MSNFVEYPTKSATVATTAVVVRYASQQLEVFGSQPSTILRQTRPTLFEVALAELLRHPDAKLLAVIQAVPEEALDRVFNVLLNFTVATESYVKEIWLAVLYED